MKSPPPRSEGSNPSLSATTQTIDLRDQRDQMAAEQWQNVVIVPLAKFMMKRQVRHLWIDVVGDNARFALVPTGEKVELFEVVDATDEERYYPLGIFLDLASAVEAAQEHAPPRWEPMVDDHAVVEIRLRTVGLSGGDYSVIWRGHWQRNDESAEWNLTEQQTGTPEKPLPLTRA